MGIFESCKHFGLPLGSHFSRRWVVYGWLAGAAQVRIDLSLMELNRSSADWHFF
jgi:hypothetical protein